MWSALFLLHQRPCRRFLSLSQQPSTGKKIFSAFCTAIKIHLTESLCFHVEGQACGRLPLVVVALCSLLVWNRSPSSNSNQFDFVCKIYLAISLNNQLITKNFLLFCVERQSELTLLLQVTEIVTLSEGFCQVGHYSDIWAVRIFCGIF